MTHLDSYIKAVPENLVHIGNVAMPPLQLAIMADTGDFACLREGDVLVFTKEDQAMLFRHDKSLAPPIAIDGVLELVSMSFGVTVSQLKSKCREGPVALARHVFFYLVYHTLEWKQTAASGFLDRTHGTVINSIFRVNKRMELSEEFKIKVTALADTIKKRK